MAASGPILLKTAIERRAAGVAVEGTEMFAQRVEIEESIDAAQQMVAWDVIFEVEE